MFFLFYNIKICAPGIAISTMCDKRQTKVKIIRDCTDYQMMYLINRFQLNHNHISFW